MTIHSLGWLAVTIYVFAFRLQGERRPTTEKILILLSVGSSLVLVPPLITGSWLSEWFAYAAGAVASFAVTALLTAVALKNRSREGMVLAFVLWPMLAMGIHDLLLMNWSLDFERFFLLPFAALPLLAAFLYCLSSRYRGAIENVEALNHSLESRLAARQEELTRSHARLREVEINNA